MLKVPENMGVKVMGREMMYKSVAQTVLLYGSKSWLITEAIMNVLEVFHHRIARSIVGKTTRRIREEGWESPPT